MDNIQGLFALEGKVLGKGSFGTVYLGTNISNDKYVALKKIPLEIMKDPQKIQALSNEILISADVENENLVTILDLTDINEDKYIVYEFCNGGDLRRYLRYFKSFDEYSVQYFMKQVLNGLSELHNKKIIHHDIKPENILVELLPENPDSLKNPQDKKKFEKIVEDILKKTKTNKDFTTKISELNLEKQKLIVENKKLLLENQELLNKLNEDGESSKKANMRFEGQVLLLSKKNTDLTHKINEISESKKKLLGVIKDNEKKLNEYNELTNKYVEMSKIVKNYEKKTNNDNNKIFELSKNIRLLENKNKELTKKLKISTLKINDLNMCVRTCDENNQLKESIKILENKISDLNTTIIREEIEKSELNDNIKELDKKNNDKQKKIELLEKKIKLQEKQY